MTYPASGSQNQWGFYTPASTYSYQPPTGTGVPPATGTLTPPQSSSGSVTGESATSNYLTGETSTENFVSEMIGAAEEGVAFNLSHPAPALNVAETTPAYNPNADSGVQQGSPAVNSACPFNTLSSAAFQKFTFQ
jgi:hypothetical protein